MNTDIFELSITRIIDAPIDAVWTIATQRMAEWWCPKPWTIEITELDWRPGGRSAMIMRGPNGEEMAQEGVFLDVKPNHYFVFTDAFRAGWFPQGPFMVGKVELKDVEGKTLYIGSARHWTQDARDQHEAMGFEQGWSSVADQLAALAESATR